MKSVEKAAAGIPGGTTTMISVTDVIPRGGSASYFERMNESYESSTPAPRLPSMGKATKTDSRKQRELGSALTDCGL